MNKRDKQLLRKLRAQVDRGEGALQQLEMLHADIAHRIQALRDAIAVTKASIAEVLERR